MRGDPRTLIPSVRERKAGSGSGIAPRWPPSHQPLTWRRRDLLGDRLAHERGGRCQLGLRASLGRSACAWLPLPRPPRVAAPPLRPSGQQQEADVASPAALSRSLLLDQIESGRGLDAAAPGGGEMRLAMSPFQQTATAARRRPRPPVCPAPRRWTHGHAYADAVAEGARWRAHRLGAALARAASRARAGRERGRLLTSASRRWVDARTRGGRSVRPCSQRRVSDAARAGARGVLLIVLLPVVFAVVAAFILLRLAFLAVRAVFTVALALASLTRS